MKDKIRLTILLTVITVAMTAIGAFSQNFTVSRHMGATLNSTANDNDATLSPNGLSLYFSSLRTDLPGAEGGADIYVSHRATLASPWGTPINLGDLNTSSNDRVLCLSLNARELFLASDRPGGQGGVDLYVSTPFPDGIDGFFWTPPLNLGQPINTELDELSAFYFEDQFVNTLIFSSNRQNGGVDYDLFQSIRNSIGTYDPPVAINELNSIGAELRPTIRRDGLEIFIGAFRPGGLGAFDIWTSTRASVSSPWNPPVLVPNINTLENDNVPSLSPDGSILYFTSNRAGSLGGLDLYSTTRCSLYSAPASATSRFNCF